MNRLKELRKKNKKTQSDIANLLQVNTKTVSRWENGEYEIKVAQANLLADYFGVNVGYLLGYEPEGMPKRSICGEVYSALLRVKSENPNHDDRVVIREICMELIEATFEGY